MNPPQPIRFSKTTLSSEQIRHFEALYLVFEKERSCKTWAQWLKDYSERIEHASPEEGFKHELFNQLFNLHLRLERIESTLMTVVDAISPKITFSEVKKMLCTEEPDDAIHEWLRGNQVSADTDGLYRRIDIIKACGNPPISS